MWVRVEKGTEDEHSRSRHYSERYPAHTQAVNMEMVPLYHLDGQSGTQSFLEKVGVVKSESHVRRKRQRMNLDSAVLLHQLSDPVYQPCLTIRWRCRRRHRRHLYRRPLSKKLSGEHR